MAEKGERSSTAALRLVQRRVTPGAVRLVGLTSATSTLPKVASTTDATVADRMQWGARILGVHRACQGLAALGMRL